MIWRWGRPFLNAILLPWRGFFSQKLCLLPPLGSGSGEDGPKLSRLVFSSVKLLHNPMRSHIHVQDWLQRSSDLTASPYHFAEASWEQSARIGTIYTSALFTIATSRPVNFNVGLFPLRLSFDLNPRSCSSCPVRIRVDLVAKFDAPYWDAAMTGIPRQQRGSCHHEWSISHNILSSWDMPNVNLLNLS
jgi:hypothetical protein